MKQASQKPASGGARGGDQPVEGDVGEGVDVEVLADLVDGHVVRQQLGAGARVDAVEARPLDGRRRQPEVHLGGPGLAEHADELLLGGAAHHRVVDDHQALAGDVLLQRVELHAHAEGPHLLAGGDEGAPDVAVLDEALAVGDATGPGEALGGGQARLGHAHHHVGLDRRLLGEQLAHAHAGVVHAAAVEAAVGPGEVDELEEAELGVEPLGGEHRDRLHAVAVDDHHLAGVELAHEVGADDVEGRRLGGEHPATRLEQTEAQGPEAVRVAHADDPLGVHDDQREGAFEAGQDLDEGLDQGIAGDDVVDVGHGLDGGAQQLGHEVGVGRDHAGQHARLGGELGGVDQVAVVAEGEPGGADRPIDRLGVAPRARPGGGVPRVADGQVAGERRQGALVEDVGHQAHVLDHGDVDTVGHRHAGRLLPAVLQGVQAQVREVGDRLVGGMHAEDPTRLFQRVVGGRRSDEVAVGGLGHRPMIARSGPTSTNPPGMPVTVPPGDGSRRPVALALLCTIRPWASTRAGRSTLRSGGPARRDGPRPPADERGSRHPDQGRARVRQLPPLGRWR